MGNKKNKRATARAMNDAELIVALAENNLACADTEASIIVREHLRQPLVELQAKLVALRVKELQDGKITPRHEAADLAMQRARLTLKFKAQVESLPVDLDDVDLEPDDADAFDRYTSMTADEIIDNA